MRFTLILAATAMAAAGPAYAQNTDTVDANAVATDNTVAADNLAVDGNAVVDNTATLDTMPVEEEVAPAPAPRPKESFPWGVLGLIGLVGLLGRRRV